MWILKFRAGETFSSEKKNNIVQLFIFNDHWSVLFLIVSQIYFYNLFVSKNVLGVPVFDWGMRSFLLLNTFLESRETRN